MARLPKRRALAQKFDAAMRAAVDANAALEAADLLEDGCATRAAWPFLASMHERWRDEVRSEGLLD